VEATSAIAATNTRRPRTESMTANAMLDVLDMTLKPVSFGYSGHIDVIDLTCLGGGIGTWTVYNTGMTLNVATSGEAAKSKGNDTGPATTTVVQNPIVVTEPSNPENKGGSNVGAIAGGVVVAVVVVALSISGFFFYMRRKRNREIEEEHRRNAAVSSFISGKAPSSSGMSITDARLDPVMAQRRLSDGSIADNQDYSRKILRVGSLARGFFLPVLT